MKLSRGALSRRMLASAGLGLIAGCGQGWDMPRVPDGWQTGHPLVGQWDGWMSGDRNPARHVVFQVFSVDPAGTRGRAAWRNSEVVLRIAGNRIRFASSTGQMLDLTYAAPDALDGTSIAPGGFVYLPMTVALRRQGAPSPSL